MLGKSLGEELGQLRDRARPLGHDLASGATDGRHVRVPHIAAPRAAAHVAALTERHKDRLQTQCVARRDEIEGPPRHELSSGPVVGAEVVLVEAVVREQ